MKTKQIRIKRSKILEKYKPIILLPVSGWQMTTQSKEYTTDRYPYSESILFFGHKPLFIFPKFQLLAYTMKCACCGGEMILDKVSEKTIVYKCRQCGLSDTRLKEIIWIKKVLLRLFWSAFSKTISLEKAMTVFWSYGQ
jgi:hypothetical protein